MRMWMIDPKIMCRQHLLGEHLELHMFSACLKAGKKLNGYLNNGCLEPKSIVSRHNELVNEMVNRGYKHKTPLECNSPYAVDIKIDREESLRLLLERCSSCKDNYWHSKEAKLYGNE